MNPGSRLIVCIGIRQMVAVSLAFALTAAVSSADAQEADKALQVLPSGGDGLPPPKIPGLQPEKPPLPKVSPLQGTAASGQASAKASSEKGSASIKELPVPGSVEEVVTFKTNFEKDVRCMPLPLNAKINVDFEEAPIKDVVKFIACITQRNFLVGTNLKNGKTVTIMSTTPVTVYEAYKAFLASLDINGLTVVPSGPFYKIVETAKAKTEVVPIFLNSEAVPAEDRLVTRIVNLKHIDVNDVSQVLSKFKTQAGDITVYQPGNSLIITDLGSNIVRMLKFVAELDVPTGREKIWVRPVQYAAASEMATMITSVFGDKGGSAGGSAGSAGRKAAPTPGAEEGSTIEGAAIVSKIIPDERTNQLIIVATPSAYLKIDRLLRRMDMPIEGEGQIHIYYLENANAEDVASTLSSLTSSGGKTKSSGKGASAAGSAGAAGGGGNAGSAASLFSGDVKVTAHKPTNSLVIESTLKDYMSVKRVIQQLDIRRKQVYVEAVIMEISSNKDKNFGISGSVGASLNIAGQSVPLMLGLGGLGISGLDMTQLQSGGGAFGMQGPLVNLNAGSTGGTTGTLSIPAYGFSVQALQSNSDVNVLSTPHILTMDNEEAEIVVGKQIPYQASSGGGMSNLMSQLGGLGASTGVAGAALSGLTQGMGYGGYVQRIDVDMTLKITPQISESNFVRLKIMQQLDDVESMDATLGPTTSKRKVTNTVVVKDQQPVVIGGLIRDVESSAVDKVPILGDIPILGALFRRTVKRVEKRNLLMIIIPYIIEDPSDLQRIHDQKLEEMREFAEYMATRKQEYQGGIDYRKKTGVLEDIRKTMNKVRKDREMLEQTRFENVDLVGVPDSHDLEYDPLEKASVGTVDASAPVPAPIPQQATVPAPVPAPLPMLDDRNAGDNIDTISPVVE